MVYEEITLKNLTDVEDFKRGHITEQEIQQVTVQSVVDTGAHTLVISDDLRKQLGLQMRGTMPVRQADNKEIIVQIASAVEVHWKNRRMVCEPWIASDSGKILLGAVPLEIMDLIVDPVQQMLVGRHGNEQFGYLY